MNETMQWAVLSLLVVCNVFLVLILRHTATGEKTPSVSPPEPLDFLESAKVDSGPESEWRSEVSRLLILSSSCSSCSTLASQMAPFGNESHVELVVVAPNRERAVEFLTSAGVGRPYQLDIAGRWASETLGLSSSPALVVFDPRRAESAWAVFSYRDAQTVSS